MKQRGQRVFACAIGYFQRVLMDHGIVSKIFNGSQRQSIFFSSPFFNFNLSIIVFENLGLTVYFKSLQSSAYSICKLKFTIGYSTLVTIG